MCDELAALIPKENLPHFWGGPIQARSSKPISSTGVLLVRICLPLPANYCNFIGFQSETLIPIVLIRASAQCDIGETIGAGGVAMKSVNVGARSDLR